jgi:hypothetical protein
MSEWIDLTVYAILIVAVWGWLSTWIARAAVLVVADRNQDWLAAHPDVERRLAGNRWFLRSCWLWGSLSLVTLCAFQVGLWPRSLAVLRETPPWEALKDLNSVLFIAGLIYVGGCSLLFSRWVGREVPLAQRRQATLEPRSIHDHIPRAFQYATYSIIVLHLTAWVAVGVAGRYATGAFWGGLAFQVAISAVFLWIVASAVRRRPVAVDRIFGPRYRQTEVRLAFAAQLLPLMNGTARLYEQAADTPLPQIDRILHLGLVLFVVAMVIMLAVRFQKNHASGQTRWPGAPASAGVVAVVALIATMALPAQGPAPAVLDDDEIRVPLAETVLLHQGGVDQRGRRLD